VKNIDLSVVELSKVSMMKSMEELRKIKRKVEFKKKLVKRENDRVQEGQKKYDLAYKQF
jgi:flagellar basal body rod protein FlgG